MRNVTVYTNDCKIEVEVTHLLWERAPRRWGHPDCWDDGSPGELEWALVSITPDVPDGEEADVCTELPKWDTVDQLVWDYLLTHSAEDDYDEY